MNDDRLQSPGSRHRFAMLALLFACSLLTCGLIVERLPGQEVTSETQGGLGDGGGVIVNDEDLQSITEDTDSSTAESAGEPAGVDLISLIIRGGGFMIPIALMSFLVVALAVERLLTLRSNHVMPKGLTQELRELARGETVDPAAAYQACSNYRSPAARVITAMLLRTGQPLGEIERTANETAQREADGLAGPVRWLNLAAAATPLMGLLGTVWGMIKAFHESTTLTPDRSRSEQLSEGIYTALVTTLAGLAVAIPAAILAQYLENRITKLFHRIERLAFEIAPGLGRYAGHWRLDRDGKMRPMETRPPGTTSTLSPAGEANRSAAAENAGRNPVEVR